MRLTVRDLFGTLFTAAVVAVAVLSERGTDLPLISGTRGALGVALVLGAAGCASGGARELADRFSAVLTFAAAIGVAALVAAIAGLATGAAGWLTVYAALTVALWLVATARHLAPGHVRRGPRPTHGGAR